jgi:hypothetical protein
MLSPGCWAVAAAESCEKVSSIDWRLGMNRPARWWGVACTVANPRAASAPTICNPISAVFAPSSSPGRK